MVESEIRVRFIDRNRVIKIISKSLKNIEYVEQLVQSVLEDEGVKPVCSILFGLRLINDKIWLAPNEPIKSFIGWSRKGNSSVGPKLEIRMRFRPSYLVRVSLLDSIAFDLIFAQINHDFMKTRFTDEKRDFVLLNDSVLGLVALNLILHSVEKGICIEDILKQVRPLDFIPQRASRWQSALLFRLSKHINLQETLRIGFEQCANDTRRIKEKFLELFLFNVAPDYNNEVYEVHQLKQASNGDDIKLEPKRLRVRYNQSQDNATCSIETCTKKKPKNHVDKHDSEAEKWVEICRIETISHATLKKNHVQIVGPDGSPQRFQFETAWQAKSFLSCIDGYYRLMKKWNFNLCCEIFSPELKYLTELGCHGPIGLETTKYKLSEHKRPDCYLIRKCMENKNKFLIDTFVFDKVLLTIDVDWIPELRFFKLTGHSMGLKGLDVSVRTEQEGYSLLNSLIYDTEIRITLGLKNNSSQMVRVHQLKYKIVPCGDDINPALLLSMSPKEFEELSHNYSLSNVKSTKELPRVLPRSSLKLVEHLQSVGANSLRVDLATMDEGQQVVIKSHEEQTFSSMICNYTFHHCPSSHGHSELENLRLSQIRLADWLFIKSDLFAETIGYMLSGSLVQEYFPLGRFDMFLQENQDTGEMVKISASFQLAQALLFLDERHIIHGKIRCRNIMLTRSDPIQIKLTDPLGAIDIVRDQAFIPSEYFNSSIKICVRKFHCGVDVWAAGTTIWQIFNQGIDPPPGRYANKLTQLRCPMKVWHLIEECWLIERDLRTKPRMLHRDFFDLMAWEQGSHHYFYINPRDSDDMIDNNYTPSTNTSSTSDLSTLDNIDSILSSPNSTYSNDSKTGLIRTKNSIDSRVNQDHNNGATTSVSYLPFRSMHTNWTVFKMMNWKRAAKRHSLSDLPPDSLSDRFSDIFGSRESLNSASEITDSTRIMDSQSISEAFDRCIWHIDSRRLELGAEIGRGSSGIVIKGIMLRADAEEEVVAVKRLDRDRRDSNSVEDLKREFDILKNLNHKNIVKTFGYADESQLMLVFEYMPLGSLLSCLRNLPTRDELFKLPLKKYALDIASGMEYLESKKIVHRDLALRNILLNDHHDAKICDFGLAQSLGSNDFYKLETERALPLKWYAPETLMTWVFTHKSDVWSYGVVLWEIFSGGDSPQYSGTYANLSETLKHERLPMPVGCPKQMYDLMLACWTYEPEGRKTFEAIRVALE